MSENNTTITPMTAEIGFSIFWHDIQKFCIRHGLYTRGTNRAYDRLHDQIVDRCGSANISDVIGVACNIAMHSDPEIYGGVQELINTMIAENAVIVTMSFEGDGAAQLDAIVERAREA
jgi:hypothetical protein